jgi:DNA topoisomerase-1
MPKSLVIVESPAKAKTINRYLGPGFVVKASMGHVRDLPKTKLGVDVEHDFTPSYVVIPDKKKVIADLRKAAEDAESIILAADPDREGEAISWHLSFLFEDLHKTIHRALFHEITKKGIEEAFQHLGTLDQNKINAQQTRRILDRLVGYKISPLLWKKIGGKNLSAGRVQSIALRLICDREKEIKAFVQEEFWPIAARLEASAPPPFKAELVKADGKKIKVETGEKAERVAADLRSAAFVLDKVNVRTKSRQPGPPYITSTLQQDGFRLLSFPVKKTMMVAQHLYEGLEIGERGMVGLITYMRTDSFRVSDEALGGARDYIVRTFSQAYLPPSPHVFKNKKASQDAHEAVRPTFFDLPPDAVAPYLKREELRLYTLIWNRFIASQMSPAKIEETEFEISAVPHPQQAADGTAAPAPTASKYLLKTKGEVIRFDGFLALGGGQKKDDEILPAAKPGEVLRLLEVETKQNFTQPPPRYTEASLVKELEAKGIGRPSTYAPIIDALHKRVYVIRDKGKFVPTELGMFVTDYLVQNFAHLMEIKFTALMEEELDRISDGERNWIESLRNYYQVLEQDLVQAQAQAGVTANGGIPAEEPCPKCGKQVVIKGGRFGPFKSCTGYPDCDYKQSLGKKEPQVLDEPCPDCGAPLVVRWGRYGQFTACSKYPECKYVKKERFDTGIACPLDCGGTLLRRKSKRGRYFYGCSSFPKCKFATWDEPIDQTCPKCGKRVLLRKTRAKTGTTISCRDEACGYKQQVETPAAPVAMAGDAKPDAAGEGGAPPDHDQGA